jgi:hypothetical protein
MRRSEREEGRKCATGGHTPAFSLPPSDGIPRGRQRSSLTPSSASAAGLTAAGRSLPGANDHHQGRDDEIVTGTFDPVDTSKPEGALSGSANRRRGGPTRQSERRASPHGNVSMICCSVQPRRSVDRLSIAASSLFVARAAPTARNLAWSVPGVAAANACNGRRTGQAGNGRAGSCRKRSPSV